jgi:hypothetical protein
MAVLMLLYPDSWPAGSQTRGNPPEGAETIRQMETAGAPGQSGSGPRTVNTSTAATGHFSGRFQEENPDDPAKNLFWRLTKDGWQYVYLEPPELVPATVEPVHPPAVHPVIVTMLIALAAMAAVAWASDEWDWHRAIRE